MGDYELACVVDCVRCLLSQGDFTMLEGAILLGLLALFASARKKGAATKVVSRMPELKPLPVFSEEQVFGPEAEPVPEAPASVPEEPAAEVVPTPGTQAAASQPDVVQQEVLSTSPPDAEDEAVPEAPDALPEPASAAEVEPTQATQEAEAQPGVVVTEVVEQKAEDLAAQRGAAEELARFARERLAAGKGAQLGTKGRPSARVRELQASMGNVVADGIYGPESRARGASLGVSMPVRR